MPINKSEYYKENLLLSYERLENKCKYFDNGDELTAIDMAVQIRTLVHDTDSSVSLLKHLSKKYIEFTDTSTPSWEKAGMCNCCFGNGFSNHTVFSQPYPKYAFLMRHFEQDNSCWFEPLLENHNKLIKFEDWWTNSVCVVDEEAEISRKDIILDLCNRDGGAHYDKKGNLKSKYLFLKKNNTLNIIIDGKETVSKNFPLFVIVRQIAYEVLETLKPLVEEYS